MHDYLLDITKNETASTVIMIGCVLTASVIWFAMTSWISIKVVPNRVDRVGNKINDYNTRISAINEDLEYMRTCRDDILKELADSQENSDVDDMNAIDKVARVCSDDYRLNEYDALINKYALEVKILESRRNLLIHNTAKRLKAGFD